MTLNFCLNNIQNVDQIVKFIQTGCAPEVPIDKNEDERYGILLAHLDIAKSVLNDISNFLSKILNNNADLQMKPQDILNWCLYLCGEHCQSTFPWSDVESHSLMNICLEKLCNLMQYINVEELFIHVDVSKLFIGLQFKLDNNWKKYPAAVESFMWMLKYIKMPHLNTLLYLVMPLPLNMFDDYQDSNIITAIDAFQHIIDNTPTVELEMSGHDIVLLKSLEHRLQSSEYHLIPHLLKCLLSLISKMQMKHLTKKNSLEWTKFDDVMHILLPRMEMEHKSESIKSYSSIFPLVLESTGFSCIRWSERLIPLFAHFIMFSHSTLATAKAIEVYIKQTWPRKCTHWNVLLTILIKALYNEDTMDLKTKKETIFVIVECIRMLETLKPKCVRDILNKLIICKEFKTKQIFKETLETL